MYKTNIPIFDIVLLFVLLFLSILFSCYLLRPMCVHVWRFVGLKLLKIFSSLKLLKTKLLKTKLLKMKLLKILSSFVKLLKILSSFESWKHWHVSSSVEQFEGLVVKKTTSICIYFSEKFSNNTFIPSRNATWQLFSHFTPSCWRSTQLATSCR